MWILPAAPRAIVGGDEAIIHMRNYTRIGLFIATLCLPFIQTKMSLPCPAR
jgi:hypothetical protein